MFNSGRVYAAMAILMLSCLAAAAWGVSTLIYNFRINELIRLEKADVQQDAKALSANIASNLRMLHGIATLVANFPEVGKTLSRHDVPDLASRLPSQQLKKDWSGDTRLRALSLQLKLASTSLAADVIYILNTAGDCIASSNIDQADSLIGTNYAGREYFRDAMKGLQGQQYAMGRVSHIPGLFFSTPVYRHGKIIGVAAAKVNLDSLAYWVNQSNAFISDRYGVVIMATDPRLLMHALKNGKIAELSEQQRLERYAIKDFPLLDISPAPEGRDVVSLTLGEEVTPLLLKEQQMGEGKLKVHYYYKLTSIAQIKRDRWNYFFWMFSTVVLVLLLIAARMAYVRARRRGELKLQRQLQFAQALNKIADALVEQDEPEIILERTAQYTGEVLGADRALIYDISFSKHHAAALSEWLNPACAGITPTKGTYPLEIFIGGTREMFRTQSWLFSHADAINPHLIEDGSGAILHGQMQIKSLLWYPFSFHAEGYYLLVLNQIGARKEWSAEEITFLDSVGHEVGIALEKIRLLSERSVVENSLRIAATAFEAQEGMVITDADGVILRVNSAFSEITGYASDEVIGKRPNVVRSGRHDAAFYTAMWESVRNSGTWSGEIWNRRKSGEIYPEHLVITAVRDGDGRITNYVGTFNDITERKAAADEIRNLAFYDLLTGLPNRRLLMDRLQHSLVSAERNKRGSALMFIDLDNFKTLNDTLGHDMGDLLLQQVARRLGDCVREVDTVARLGGDEFVVMLEGLGEHELEVAANARAVGEKILNALNASYALGSHDYHSTPSIGVTLFHDASVNIEGLFKQADIAMYQAKKAGRNTLRFFDPEMQRSLDSAAALEHELRRAIQDNQLRLYYQMQVDEQLRPTGVEALIRWLHPERGIVMPGQFIPLAEECGLISVIGHWVLDTACAQIKAWEQRERMKDLVLSINVSAKQFRQLGFAEQVGDVVRRHGINPALLKLELTESLLLEDVDSVIAVMKQLNELNIRFSLDDFGTGYSSLQYLKKLPLDQLKIDQSFTRDITTDNNDQAIVETIIAMAKSLNLGVIAEGVETSEQQELLRAKGCRQYQGYLFSKPVPVEQLEALLVA